MKISDRLRKASSKLLVIVVDIDRLSGDEVREVFRLIKSVANFPNVTYLLAFDREAVCRMLEPMQGGTGEEYLEKIVQVPFELSNPNSTAIQQMMFKRLDAIFAATPDNLFHKDRWQTVFTALCRLIKTPRDAVRLTNSLSLSYGPVREEVDAVDFLVIEAVRVFIPQVYDLIRGNSEMFREPSWRSPPPPSAEDMKKFHTNWSEALTADGSITGTMLEPVKEILSAVFPNVEKSFRHPLFSRGSGDIGPMGRRICDNDAFPVYFYLSVPETSVSRAEMNALLSLTAEDLTRILTSQSHAKRIDRLSRVRATLEVLPDYARGLSPDQSIVLAKALFRAGDDLLKADRSMGPLSPPQAWLVSHTLKNTMLNLAVSKRFEVLEEAIRGSHRISAFVWVVDVLGQRAWEKWRDQEQ
jgi:predicted KAP-like P-loop ATPase